MGAAEVLVTQCGPIRTLTLNRPASLNSFTAAMHDRLLGELSAAADDREVRCVILTGSGRAFCAGQDLSDPAVAPAGTSDAPPKDLGGVIDHFYKPLVQKLRSMPVPVVASVNGVAAGAGANLALNCDIVIAGRSASFIQPFVKIGLIPDTGGTWLLPRLIGRARALGLILLGEKLGAGDAERIGLIWKCVEDANLSGETQAIAERLARSPTKALVQARHAVDDAQALSTDGALDREARLQAELGFAPDYREGVAAFMAKRSPDFSDR